MGKPLPDLFDESPALGMRNEEGDDKSGGGLAAGGGSASDVDDGADNADEIANEFDENVLDDDDLDDDELDCPRWEGGDTEVGSWAGPDWFFAPGDCFLRGATLLPPWNAPLPPPLPLPLPLPPPLLLPPPSAKALGTTPEERWRRRCAPAMTEVSHQSRARWTVRKRRMWLPSKAPWFWSCADTTALQPA